MTKSSRKSYWLLLSFFFLMLHCIKTSKYLFPNGTHKKTFMIFQSLFRVTTIAAKLFWRGHCACASSPSCFIKDCSAYRSLRCRQGCSIFCSSVQGGCIVKGIQIRLKILLWAFYIQAQRTAWATKETTTHKLLTNILKIKKNISKETDGK